MSSTANKCRGGRTLRQRSLYSQSGVRDDDYNKPERVAFDDPEVVEEEYDIATTATSDKNEEEDGEEVVSL